MAVSAGSLRTSPLGSQADGIASESQLNAVEAESSHAAAAVASSGLLSSRLCPGAPGGQGFMWVPGWTVRSEGHLVQRAGTRWKSTSESTDSGLVTFADECGFLWILGRLWLGYWVGQ